MPLYDTVRSHYAASAAGDLPGMLAPLSAASTWTEAAGSAYAGVYTGPDAVVAGVFARIGAEWTDFRAGVDDFVDGDTTVVAIGNYTATHTATGKPLVVRFTHIWRVRDGIVHFEQVADTALLLAAAR
ncbi:Ketosteroid isomerase-related protein [Alloactinosynnema sp. L-07]|uniref:nuclear transport factor 2 family protein n=1 Tax=Alloactinosynnema sp. L-07 TaxID=1653480 RepID=UPI00065F0564|nr:nuclear transport factor 2 family protein [Alloactinosynnema sp. L-07]CRK57832.1 Ketosteroid isomerase-related protein [Alloactinosynnema sp. L-07]